MTRHWLLATPAERRLLPEARLRGPMPWVLAIMMFVTVTVAAAALALANGARIVAEGVESRYSLQIAGGAAEPAAAAERLRRVPGVAAVRPVPERELRDTLRRWLGSAGLADELPLPAMIDLELAAGADLALVERAIAEAVPGARLAPHGQSLRPLLDSLGQLQILAWTVVLLMAAATAAAVVLATRAALDTNRPTIEVIHGIGATDEQIVALFQQRIALDALAGGIAGSAAAGLALLLIVRGNRDLAAELGGQQLLGPSDFVLLAMLPLIGAVLSTLVARTAVLASLKRQP